MGGVIFSLVYGSLPAIRAFGVGFLFSQSWYPVTENFGALAPVYGTLVTSLIAMFFAVPMGIGVAIFLTELCPYPLRRPIGVPRHRTARGHTVDHLRHLGPVLCLRRFFSNMFNRR